MVGWRPELVDDADPTALTLTLILILILTLTKERITELLQFS